MTSEHSFQLLVEQKSENLIIYLNNSENNVPFINSMKPNPGMFFHLSFLEFSTFF